MGACASRNGQVVIDSTQQRPVPILTLDEGGARADEDKRVDSLKKGDTSDADVWDDEGASAATKAETSPPISPEQSRRRRLSVSTVETQQPKAALSSGELSPNAVDARGSRTKLTKYVDPALELVDRNRGVVKEVTLQMLREVFPRADHYTVFGSPSHEMQRGFDNKIAEIEGVMPMGKCLKDIGVAYACKKGLKPESPNQDDFFVMKVDDWSMYGVFDGHGPCGHDISAFVHKTLPFLILSDPLFETDLHATIRRAFWRVHHLIEAAAEQIGSNMDCSLSGTTATIVVHRDGKLTVGHVGDSRAVMAQRKEGKLTATNLTNDHKPTNIEERARIESSGGEVRRLEGDIPHRVFVRNRMYPGLAMSRAIGDLVGVAVGVTPDPDIYTCDVTAQDKFFIIATDGVWEFISSQQAVDLVGQKRASQVDESAEMLAYESWKRWVEEEENVVDDVTCIVVWLDTSDKGARTRASRHGGDLGDRLSSHAAHRAGSMRQHRSTR